MKIAKLSLVAGYNVTQPSTKLCSYRNIHVFSIPYIMYFISFNVLHVFHFLKVFCIECVFFSFDLFEKFGARLCILTFSFYVWLS